MPDFKPTDQVVHLISREEGTVKGLFLMRAGSNTLEVLLVQVGNTEKIWLPHEVEPLIASA